MTHKDKINEFVQNNRWDDGIIYIKSIIDNEGANKYLLEKLGFFYSQNQHYDKAVEIFKSLYEKEARFAKWPYMIGFQFYQREMYNDAIIYFDKSIDLDNTYIKPIYRKGISLVKNNKTILASKEFKKVIGLYEAIQQTEYRDENKKYYLKSCFQLGKLYLQNQNPNLAYDLFIKARGIDNLHDEIYYNIAKALYMSANYKEALDELKKCKKNTSWISSLYGKIYNKLEEYETAESYLNKSLNNQKKNHNIWYHLGITYKGQKKYRDSKRCFERAIDLRKKHYNLEFNEAFRELKNITEVLSNIGDTHNNDRDTGIVTYYNTNRGYGFIKSKTIEKIFFHIKDLPTQNNISEGIGVTFTLLSTKKGYRAVNIEIT